MPEPQRLVREELRTESVLTWENVKVFCDQEGVTSQRPDCTELHSKWEVRKWNEKTDYSWRNLPAMGRR